MREIDHRKGEIVAFGSSCCRGCRRCCPNGSPTSSPKARSAAELEKAALALMACPLVKSIEPLSDGLYATLCSSYTRRRSSYTRRPRCCSGRGTSCCCRRRGCSRCCTLVRDPLFCCCGCCGRRLTTSYSRPARAVATRAAAVDGATWVRAPGVSSPHPTGDLPLLGDR